MSDMYRRQLPSYRAEQAREQFSAASMSLDPDRAEVLKGYVRRLLADDQDKPLSDERRRYFRRPYPAAMLLTPCDEHGQPLLHETQTVVAKDFSTADLGFVHTRAITEKQVILTFLMPGSTAPLCVLASIRRCQPIRQGLYLIGAEFISRVALGATHERPR